MAYLVSELKCTLASRKFDKIKPECKLSGKCLVFHSIILISLKIAEFRTPTLQDVRKKVSEILNYLGSQLFYINNDKQIDCHHK